LIEGAACPADDLRRRLQKKKNAMTTPADAAPQSRTPRKTSLLIGRACDALDLWIANEALPDAADWYDRLLPWERVGDLDDAMACRTALALSPRCLAGSPLPAAARDFVEAYETAWPSSDLAARFARRSDDEVIDFDAARMALGATLRFMWPEFGGWEALPPGPRGIENYLYDLHGEYFWYLPHMLAYSSRSIDGAVGVSNWPTRTVREADGRHVEKPVPPHQWLKDSDNGQTVDGVAWRPGAAKLIHNVIFGADGPRYIIGKITINTWTPGPPVPVDAGSPDKWVYLVERMFPNRVEREELLNRLAFIVQRPGGIVEGITGLVGPQGVGKDALLMPLNHALGHHNVRNIVPDELVSRWNGHLRSQLTILNEVRLDPRDGGAHEMYSKMKSYYMTPPTIIGIEDKNVKMVYHQKSSSLVLTSNEIASLHIPRDDRRVFLPEIGLKARWNIDEGRPEFFVEYFHWLRHEGGYEAVHKYLAERDISNYDVNRPPPMTRTKRQAQELTEGGDDAVSRAIERLGAPEAFFEVELHDLARNIGPDNMGDFPNHDLQIALRGRARDTLIEAAGYVRFPKPDGGGWNAVVSRPAQGVMPMKLWRKRSRAAWVLREVWGEVRERVVVAHLQERLRRLALGDPRLGKGGDGEGLWVDPSNGREMRPLPRLLTAVGTEASPEPADLFEED
jgi:hypothetical protein